jgi:hypothetical protein
MNTLCGQKVEVLNVKLVVRLVTTGFQRVKYPHKAGTFEETP